MLLGKDYFEQYNPHTILNQFFELYFDIGPISQNFFGDFWLHIQMPLCGIEVLNMPRRKIDLSGISLLLANFGAFTKFWRNYTKGLHISAGL